MVLFATPFLLAGLGVMFFLAAKPMARLADSASWIECEARIDPSSVALRASSDNDGGTTYKAQAFYKYTAPDGGAHVSDKVAFSSGSDNIGSWQHDTYRKLKEMSGASDAQAVSVCYVNPKDYSESVLLREVHEQSIIFGSLFGFVFACAGACLMLGAIRARLRSGKRGGVSGGSNGSGSGNGNGETVRPASFSSPSDILIAAVPVGLNLWLLHAFKTSAPDASAWIWLLLIPIAALILAVLYGFMSRRVFGDAAFTPAKKIRIGGEISGDIKIKNGNPGNDFEIKITCVRSETTGSSKHRHTTTTTLWESDPIATQAANTGDGISLRVSTRIPHILLEPDAADNPDITWTLMLKAKDRKFANRLSFILHVCRPEERTNAEAARESDRATLCAPSNGGALLALNEIAVNSAPSGALEIVFPSEKISSPKEIARDKLAAFGALAGPLFFTAVSCGMFWRFFFKTGTEPTGIPKEILSFFCVFFGVPILIGIFSCRSNLRAIRKKHSTRVLVIDWKHGATLYMEFNGKRKKIASTSDPANLKISAIDRKGNKTENLHLHPRSASPTLLSAALRTPEYAEAVAERLTEKIRLHKDSR
jgi:Protein of unknown function (DUF3592).